MGVYSNKAIVLIINISVPLKVHIICIKMQNKLLMCIMKVLNF